VRDNGRGIPLDERERIFRPFHTTKHAGTGLGLAIVRQIVQRHGGTVGVTDGSAGGARFVVRLPLPGTPHAQGSET